MKTVNQKPGVIPPKKLRLLLEAGESEVLDYKQEVSSESKIAKTIVAFANHKGGKLLIGIKDNGSIQGISAEEERFMIEKAAGFYCKPEIPVNMKEWNIGKKTILEVEIPPGTDKPYYALGDDGKWWAYIRVKDQSLLASKVVLNVLKRETSGRQSVIRFTGKEQALLDYLSEHNKITLAQYCKMMNISKRRATGILVNMIQVGVIRVHHTETPEYYTLSG